MIKSASNLELLLHCYYSAVPHPRLEAPAVRDGIQYLLDNHMIKPDAKADVWNTTDKGEFYLKFLMTIPFPSAVWKIQVPEQTILLSEGD